MHRWLMVMGAAIVLAGCTSTPSGSTGGVVRVLATETFLGDIAQQVAGERAHVDVLLPPGVDPHEFQPAPQDAIKLAQSQVLIENGLGYEAWLTKSLEAGGGERVIVVATTGLMPTADLSGEHPAGDPHMWMNPLNVVRYTENIRDGLSKADPAGQEIYAANAQAYIAKLHALDGWIRSEVSAVPAEKRLLVTNHDALGYFAEAYGFQVVGLLIPSVTNEAAPSAKQMAALIDTIKRTRAPAIFLDASEKTSLAAEMAAATGAKVVNDLYVETLSDRSGPAASYIEMMRHDATEIVSALK